MKETFRGLLNRGIHSTAAAAAPAAKGRVMGHLTVRRLARAALTVALAAGAASAASPGPASARTGPAAGPTHRSAAAPATVVASSCGALRDFPGEWTVYNGDNPCPGWGFSYILTSPSDVHYATWSWASTGGIIATSGTYPLQAWIPSEDAGADTEYDAQYCGVSGWTRIGTINQQQNHGWTPVSGGVALNDSVPLCAIREHNIGPGTWDLAEDALRILSSGGN